MQEKNAGSLSHVQHSLAHILAMALLEHDKEAKLAIGPVIENGFYYDFELSKPLSEADLPGLLLRMRELVKEGLSFQGKEISAKEARKLFGDAPYKLELIDEFEKSGEPITVFSSGTFTDLCAGGHVKNTKEINPEAFTLERIAGAYWRGNEKNKMLTRIYGLAFSTKEELAAYLIRQEEAKKRDHKKLGKELDLFVFSETVGKGLPLFTHNGSVIRRELERFIVDEEIRRGYLHVYTPDIAKIELYEKSGHYPYYKDSMYAPIEIDEERFMLRPMTCPHHFELYLSRPHSYRELPMRIAELAQLYRYEQSGELSGLQRVRTFCLADSHIICLSEEEAMKEIDGALNLIEYATSVLGLSQGTHYWYRLSLGDRANPEKYYENDSAWEKGETLMRELLSKRGDVFTEAKGEAAFYGPKIDIQMRNVNGKEDTAFTVQYDFCMPDRFNLTYTDKDGAEKRAFVIHRSSIGAIERIMAFLIEECGGAFPLWLSPIQIAVLPISEKQEIYAKEIFSLLKDTDIRAKLFAENDTLGKKIRTAKENKIPYFVVIGEKEVAEKVITLEKREGASEKITPAALIEKLTREIKERTR